MRIDAVSGHPYLHMPLSRNGGNNILEYDELVFKVGLRADFYELFQGKCYATDSGVALDVTVTALDVSAATASLATRAQTLLSERIEKAEDPAEVYDENNEYRADVVAAVLREAAEQTLENDAQLTDRELTLQLVYQDGQWWIVPDAALLQAISGGVA